MKFYINCFSNGKTIVKKYVRFLMFKPICSAREFRRRNPDEYSLACKLNICKNKKGWLKTILAKGIFLRAIKDETSPSIRRRIKYRLIRNSEFKTLKDY